MTTSTKKQGPSVTIDCPRCAGKGIGLWHPDGGICYLCKGEKTLSVDIARSERHLAYLRDQYAKTRAVLDEVEGRDRDLTFEALALLTRKGEQRRALHDAALEALAAQKEVA